MKVKGVLRMHSTAKTIGDKKSGNSFSSKLVAEVQFKKRSNSSLTIFGTPKCSLKKLGSSALKRKVEASSSKRTGNNIAHKDGSSDAAACDRKSLKKVRDKDVAFDWPERNEANASGHVKRRRCKSKRRQKGQTELDQACRLQRRTRYLMIKMKLEQNLIDAYSGEGWKGQSREKIKPEKELLRAKKQILKCKLGIRDVFHQLDLLSSVGSIEGSVIAPDGSVYHEHIFCAKCKSRDAFPDNDIVLCDGTCNCAFHQKCLEPPLETENLPPEDQGWFCKFCECKMEIVEAMNAHIGTQFSVDSKWQDIFKEEAAFPDGAPSSNLETEWPSDDSEDDDYDPKRGGNSCSDCGGSDACALDDSTCSTSLSWSLHDSPEISGEEIIGGRRKRQAVDYKKLYEEMFGKDALPHEPVSEDEDWGPNKVKCREKESDAISCLMTLGESETKCQNDESGEVERKLVSVLKSKTSCRIPLTAVEKLRQVFAENELPSRGTKAKLSDELGLEPEKVNKWFKNARYLAIKSRKAECREQFDISAHRVFDDSDQRAAKSKTVVALTSENALEGNELGGTHMKRKRNPKLSQECAEKYIEASSSSATKSNKARKEAGDDVILKELLKRRENKKVDGVRLQEFEGVMEKICAAKIRLENVKKRLLRLANGKARKFNGCHFQSVTYVPIVKVKEKNRSC